jgi:hypothetical protein
MMRRSFCPAVAFMLALVVVSASNVSAIGPNKIQNTEWLVTTTWTWYSAEGYYEGAAAGGDAFMKIGLPEDPLLMTWKSTVNSFGLIMDQGYMELHGYTYNATTNILRSTSGYAEWPVGDNFYAYEGDLIAKITFRSANAFTGNVTIVNSFGFYKLVISLNGKRLGQMEPR